MKKYAFSVVLLLCFSMITASCGSKNSSSKVIQSDSSSPTEETLEQNLETSSLEINAPNEENIPNSSNEPSPIDPIKALFQLEQVSRSSYMTKRFLQFCYYQADCDVISNDQEGFYPNESPIIEKDAESDFIFHVSWTQYEDKIPYNNIFLVAKEDGKWKIDNVLTSSNGPLKYQALFDYSHPVQEGLAYDEETYEFTAERIADSKSVPEFVPEIPIFEYKEKNHEYVDLGLLSGTLWATCNVGASTPDEWGDFFAWGETYTKEAYTWSNYSFLDNGGKSLKPGEESIIGMRGGAKITRYNPLDGKAMLSASDDVASVKWGGCWRTPTEEEIEELINSCIWTWTTIDGQYGYKVSSRSNDNSIFLPLTGVYWGDEKPMGNIGVYWSSSVNVGNIANASTLYFRPEEKPQIYYNEKRSMGVCIRPVCHLANSSIRNEPSKRNGHEYVDLGLPSGLLWATCNIGASSQTNMGVFVSWGEVYQKNDYLPQTYKWYDDDEEIFTKYCTFSKYGPVDNKMILESADDAAAVSWGEGWRIPTQEEWKELIYYCEIKSQTVDGTRGYLIISKSNGRAIFLPTTGLYTGRTFYTRGMGFYWSSSLNTSSNISAWSVQFTYNNNHIDFLSRPREHGISVRPVCEPD